MRVFQNMILFYFLHLCSGSSIKDCINDYRNLSFSARSTGYEP